MKYNLNIKSIDENMAFQLKNVNEYPELKQLYYPVPNFKPHPDTEYLEKVHHDYCNQWSDNVYEFGYLNIIVTSLCCNTAVTKERLALCCRAFDLTLYVDIYFEPVQKTRSLELLDHLGNKLLKAMDELKYDGNDSPFISKTLSAVNDICVLLNEEQKDLFIGYLKAAFKGHINYNKDYYLKNKVIPLKEYFALRSDESFWRMILFMQELSLDYAVPTATRKHPLFNEFFETATAFSLAYDDYLLLKNKLGVNDDTNAIISYAVTNNCPLQEAIYYHYNNLFSLEKKCKDLMKKIGASTDIYTEELQIYMESVVNVVLTVWQLLVTAWKYEVLPDNTIRSVLWDDLYKKMLNKTTMVHNAWSFHY